MTIDYSHGKYIGCISKSKLDNLEDTLNAKYQSPTSIDGGHNYVPNSIQGCRNLNADYVAISHNTDAGNNDFQCITLESKKQKSKFEKNVSSKNACNNGFKSPEWIHPKSPSLLKLPVKDNMMVFKLKNTPTSTKKSLNGKPPSSVDIKNPPYDPIGYYNINNIDALNNIEGYSYITSRDGVNPAQAKIVTPGASFEQGTSNANLMTAFLVAEQNNYELVMVYTGTQSQTPVVFMGHINKMMKDCNVDIVRGYINPFFGSLTDKPKDESNQYKVYLRPDLKLDDFINNNTECSKKIQSQYKTLRQNYVNNIRFNANLSSVKKLDKSKTKHQNNILSSIYKNLDMIEHYDNSISEKQTEQNVDSYFDAQKNNVNTKSSSIASKYKDELDDLKSTHDDISETADIAVKLATNQDNTIKNNYVDLQNINQKLYKLNSNIDTTSEKLDYNKNIVRILRIFLLCLFIFMLCMIGYYGVRNAYKNKSIANSNPKLQYAMNGMKSVFRQNKKD